MASLTRWRGDLTSETQHSEKEESDPVWTFAQLRRLGFGLVTISHANLVSLIRIARPSAHHSNDSGEWFLLPFVWCPRTPARGVAQRTSDRTDKAIQESSGSPCAIVDHPASSRNVAFWNKCEEDHQDHEAQGQHHNPDDLVVESRTKIATPAMTKQMPATGRHQFYQRWKACE